MKQKKFSFSLSKKSKWSLRVQYGNISEELTLTPPEPVAVRNEKCPALPVFDPQRAGWNTPYGLKRIMKPHCRAEGALVPGSVTVKGPRGIVYERGRDLTRPSARMPVF